MRNALWLVLIPLLVNNCQSQTQYQHYAAGVYPGNSIKNLIVSKTDSTSFWDYVDDTVNYRPLKDRLYIDTAKRIFIRSFVLDLSLPKNDSFIFIEYYQDVSAMIDAKTYRPIVDDYFISGGKVYIWWADSDHQFPIEVTGADTSFTPFGNVAGGKDKLHVYAGGPPSGFEIIKEADVKTTIALKPERNPWNGGGCYFVDDKSVFFGLKKIAGADPKTFKLLNQEKVNAEDKNHKYFDGEIVK